MTWWSEYIGIPFLSGGRGSSAYDCWGLVRAVYADRLGLELPSYGEISADDLVRVARAMDRAKDDGWVPCGPQPFAVVLMRHPRGGRRIVHVGVMVDDKRVMHVEEATSTVVVPVDHMSVSGRIVGYRRMI